MDESIITYHPTTYKFLLLPFDVYVPDSFFNVICTHLILLYFSKFTYFFHLKYMSTSYYLKVFSQYHLYSLHITLCK
jgi:hypothetical protein